MKTIGFIGAGNMAEAIVKGIDRTEFLPPQQIGVTDVNVQRLEHFAAMGHRAFADCRELVAFADYLVLSVKPQQMADVLAEAAPALREGTAVISIAAGISADYIRRALGRPELVVIPVMPNTPLLIAEGATAVGREEDTPAEQLAFVKQIFAASGKVWELPADKLSEVIPANSSSPAFIYYYTKLFCDQISQYGLERETVKEMFCQTLIGAARMMLESGEDIDDLIVKVCSKGGTTIAGIEGFQAKGLDAAVAYGIQRCIERAHELGQANG